MLMKKLLILFLVLFLLAGGFFLWKGGHHAVFLSEVVEEWLDTDDADQTLTIQLQQPDFTADDTGKLQPRVQQLTITADTFWTEYHDERLLGISASGCTAYVRDHILYMDTGRAYTLPSPSEYSGSLRELALGLLLHGRIRKNGDVYELTMTRPELDLRLSVTADPQVHGISLRAVTQDKSVIQATLTPKSPQSHSIPQPVLDAMVLSKMEKPMLLSEPLRILLPALQNLLPLRGNLTLGVECGILNLSETVVLRMDEEKAELERKGTTIPLPLSGDLSQSDPAVLVLILLRNGTFSRDEASAEIRLDLPPEITNSLCTTLVPQIQNLDIEFGGSQAVLTFRDSALQSVTMTAQGEVPFLVATIPVAFRAELTIS